MGEGRVVCSPLHFAGAVLLLAWLVGGAVGCGGTAEYAVVGTARAPGIDGTVQIEEIEGQNHLVTVSTSNVVPPARLGPELRTYLVWFQPDQGPVVKAGQLQYDEDSRTGSMMATTPHRSFQLRITAERNVSATSPSDVVVTQRRVAAE